MSSSDIKAKEGDLVNLLCSAQGEPPIIFYWEKDQKTVKSSVEIDKPQRLSSFLVLTIKDKTSFGQYICHIRDRFQILVQRMEDCNYQGNFLTGSLKNEILFTALVGLNKIRFLKKTIFITYAQESFQLFYALGEGKNDDCSKTYLAGTIVLVILLIILLMIISYLIYQRHQPQANTENKNKKKDNSKDIYETMEIMNKWKMNIRRIQLSKGLRKTKRSLTFYFLSVKLKISQNFDIDM